MSEENVEIVQRIFEGWAVGDFGAGLADLDPDVVFVVRHPFPEAVETAGPDGIREYMRRFLDNWESYAVEARDLQAVGDVVVADAVQRGEGKASRIEMEQEFFMLFTFVGGKIVRIESILERDQALEAAGLREWAMPEENVELLRQTVDAINRGDIDGVLENAADDFEVDWSNAIGPGRKGIYHGKDQAREFWTSFVEAFDEFRWDFEEIIGVDESRVIAVNHVRGRGRGSGAEVEGVNALLFTVSDGKARSVKLFQSKPEALEAAGLRE